MLPPKDLPDNMEGEENEVSTVLSESGQQLGSEATSGPSEGNTQGEERDGKSVSELSEKDQIYNKNPMWKEITKAMHCIIDDHLVRLLDINGYRSYEALKLFEEEDFIDVENFVRSGSLEERVKSEEELKTYLGSAVNPKTFRLLSGEKKLIRQIVKYVAKNHTVDDKPLGKSMSMYPLFKNASRKPSSCDNNNNFKKQKTDESSYVVSYNFPEEVTSIRKLIKCYLIKKKFPNQYVESVPNITVTVKTFEKESCPSLSTTVICPLCFCSMSGYRERKTIWNLSNVNRHFNLQKKKSDNFPGTVSKIYFQRTSPSKELEKTLSADEDDDLFTQENEANSNASECDGLNTSVAVSQQLVVPTNLSSTSRNESSTASNPTGMENFLEKGGCDGTSASISPSHCYSNNPGNCSRIERRKRALGRHVPGQTRIPVYFPVLNEIEITLKANKEIISALEARCKELTLQVSSCGNFDVSFLLKLLMETAQKNSQRKNHGQRYDEDLKLFAIYLFIVGGRMIYEFLCANLPNSIPSCSQVEVLLRNSSQPVIEGVFRFQELLDFLMANNLPCKVSISEDGTRIQEKFCYDATTNQIIGPVLPLADNGEPVSQSFPATSAAMIASHLKNGKASTGYAIMAQPLQNGAPAFCLTLFCTDNRFSSEHVYRRWSFISEELGKLGIEVVNFSSDGDPKMLSSMHSHMFGSCGGSFRQEWSDWFFATANQKFTVMQDPIHTANKFRNRLNPSTLLPIGNFTASQTHLRILIKTVEKEQHGLTEYDLDKDDKMNFNASLKICSEKVTSLLKTKVVGSDATVAYLTNMRYLIEAYLDDSLSASERLYKIWHCLFFLRFWKLFLLNHTSYTMNNFVTSNLYVCVEVIAHALIKLVVKFREESSPELFLVQLLSSQPCESCFRLARSMTSTQSTVINFCMKEFLSRVKRIDVLYHIISTLSAKLIFPREKSKKLLGVLTQEKLQSSYLPSDKEIFEIVMNAKSDAIVVIKDLGMKLTANISLSRIKLYLASCKIFEDEALTINASPSNYQSQFGEDDKPLDMLAAFPSPDDIPSLEPLCQESIDKDALPPDSIFVMFPKSTGGFVRMRKSTFCWLLVSSGSKLSSDRLHRVRQAVCFSLSNLNLKSQATPIKPERKIEIEVGEWCVFKK